MSWADQVPEHVFRLLEAGVVSEFATVSAAGVPIDTPTYYFPTEDMEIFGIATGLSYPAKAERARRNPKVGMFFEGADDEPVIAIRGRAAVRDADLQANAVRYISETGFDVISFGLSWEEGRKAVWYWTRMIVEVMPERIMWWDNRAAMAGPPQVWNAPADTLFPQSDPAPQGKGSPPSQWPQRTWQEIAEGALARGVGAHFTVCDDDGYPVPVRVQSFEFLGDGFRMKLPKGWPVRAAGKATLTFEGIETFVGEATPDGEAVLLKVERALPEHPLMKNPTEVLRPSEEVRSQLMARLEVETSRRGQSIPILPAQLPEPTRMARLRKARLAGDVPITGFTDRGLR